MSVLPIVLRTAAALACAAFATPALAATFNVTRLDDPTPGACLPAS